jgi:triosephosphate isomerase
MPSVQPSYGRLAPKRLRAIPVLYGGSVNLENAADVLAYGAVDEMFVGRAAWQPAGMAALIRSAIRHLTLAETGNAPAR